MKQEKNDINDAFKSAPLSEKIWLFFQKNFKPIAIIAAAFIALSVLFGFGKLYSSCKICKMKREYAEIVTREDKLSFVKKYKCCELSGIVWLYLGDESLSKGDLEAAKSEYAAASKALKKTILFPRAQIGLAVTEYKFENFDECEKILNSIIYNKTFDSSLRGNAACILVSMLKEKDAAGRIESFVKELDGLDLSQTYISVIRNIAEED